MKVILMRHALPELSTTIPNEALGLCLKGKKQQFSTNQFLHEKGVRIGCIYTSPTKRAKETALMVGECFSCPVVAEEALGSNFREERLNEIIQDSPYDTICFIGHAPTLTEFAQSLVGSIPIPDISRSSALVIDVEKEGGHLQCHPCFYITPDGVALTFDDSESQLRVE